MINSIRKRLSEYPANTQWDKGVKRYARDLLTILEENIQKGAYCDAFLNRANLKQALLNGARTWEEYSTGGCSLMKVDEIRARLKEPELPSTVRKKRYKQEPDWYIQQARALRTASMLIVKLAFGTSEE